MRVAAVIAFCVAALGAALAVANPTTETEPEPKPVAATPTVDGGALYNRLCLACHGETGNGLGPAAPWLWPQPRDFSTGEFKWRSTPAGEPPTDADLAAAIRHGVPGTSMHAFDQTLSSEQVAALVRVVKSFAPDEFEEPGTVAAIGKAPPRTAELVSLGKAKYKELGCDQCHGEQGKGDGPSAAELKDGHGRPAIPYDLTARPLRRPGPVRRDAPAAIVTSLVTGLAGTPMPSYQGTSEADLWAIAYYVDSIRLQGWKRGPNNDSRLDPIMFARDRRQRIVDYGVPTGHAGDEASIFDQTIELQGEPPDSLAPAQASLSARRCERCHAKQAREWKTTLHGGASSPGLIAQFPGMHPASVESCQKCHAPLAEQLQRIRPAHKGGGDDRTYSRNASYDAELRAEGITCAACHVRKWQRFGPELVAESKLLSLPRYPRTELAIYERADLCIGCHQLPPRSAVAGKPRLNTYREWLEGPYMRRGVQCQHCHMPNREHTWKGVHDPDTFRQGYRLDTLARRNPKTGAVTVRARMTNVGAGHFLPTTPTPAAWISVELVDGNGKRIRGAYAEQRIGWHLEFSRGVWKEIDDTRIPPGESLELARAWKKGRVPEATHAKVIVRVSPDDFYEGLYTRRLAGKPGKEPRKLFEVALERTRKSKYVSTERLVEIE